MKEAFKTIRLTDAEIELIKDTINKAQYYMISGGFPYSTPEHDNLTRLYGKIDGPDYEFEDNSTPHVGP